MIDNSKEVEQEGTKRESVFRCEQFFREKEVAG